MTQGLLVTPERLSFSGVYRSYLIAEERFPRSALVSLHPVIVKSQPLISWSTDCVALEGMADPQIVPMICILRRLRLLTCVRKQLRCGIQLIVQIGNAYVIDMPVSKAGIEE